MLVAGIMLTEDRVRVMANTPTPTRFYISDEGKIVLNSQQSHLIGRHTAVWHLDLLDEGFTKMVTSEFMTNERLQPKLAMATASMDHAFDGGSFIFVAEYVGGGWTAATYRDFPLFEAGMIGPSNQAVSGQIAKLNDVIESIFRHESDLKEGILRPAPSSW